MGLNPKQYGKSQEMYFDAYGITIIDPRYLLDFVV